MYVSRGMHGTRPPLRVLMFTAICMMVKKFKIELLGLKELIDDFKYRIRLNLPVVELKSTSWWFLCGFGAPESSPQFADALLSVFARDMYGWDWRKPRQGLFPAAAGRAETDHAISYHKIA